MQKVFNKLTAVVSSAAITAATVVVAPIANAAFMDVPSNAWFANYVQQGVEAGFFAEGQNFRPSDNLNRAELAKLAYVLAEERGVVSGFETSDKQFSDVPSDAWFYNYVQTLAANGIVGGYENGTFGPNDSVTRAQAAKVMVEAAGLEITTTPAAPFTDLANDWSDKYITTAYNFGLVDGVKDASGALTGKFNPSGLVNRAEMAKMLTLAVDAGSSSNGGDTGSTGGDTGSTGGDTGNTGNTGGDTGSTGGNTGTQAPAGTLTVALSPNTPASATVPSASSAVEFARFDLSASAGSDITVSEIFVKRNGVGAASNFDGVYLYDGANRLTNDATINTSDNLARFINLGLVVKAGTTRTISVRADIATLSSTAEGGFSIDSIKSSAATTVPSAVSSIAGRLMTINSTTGGTVDIDGLSLANTDVRVGQTDVEVARFQITAPSGQDAEFSSIAIVQNGSIDRSSLANFKLKASDGTVLATAAGMTEVRGDDLVTLALTTPVTMTKAASRTFSVTADIVGGKSAETIDFSIDNSADIRVKGLTLGYDVAVDANGGTAGNGLPVDLRNTVATVKAAKLTIVDKSPAATDIVQSQKGVVFAEYTLTSGSDLEIKGMAFTVTSSINISTDGTVNYLNNVKVVDDKGNTLLSDQMSDVNATTETLDMDNGIFILKANETKTLKFVADIPSDQSTGSAPTYVVTLKAPNTWGDIRDLGTNKKFTTDDFNEVVPNTDLAGKTMTVRAASLTVAKSAAVPAGNVVVGTDKINLGAVSFTAGRGSDIRIRTLAISGQRDADQDGNYDEATPNETIKDTVSAIYLFDGTTQVGSAQSFSNARPGIATFSGLNFVVPNGQSKTLTVKADVLRNGITDAADNVRIFVSSVTSEDAADKNVTATNNFTTGTGNAITVKSTGSLFVALDSNTRTTGVVVFGTNDNAIATYRFESQDESFTLKKLRFNLSGSAASSVNQLKLRDQAGTIVGTATVTGTTADFSGLNIVVSGVRTLTVLADVNSLSAGITSGNTLTADLETDDNTSSIEVQSNGSNTTLDNVVASGNTFVFEAQANGDGTSATDIAANSMTLLATRATVTANTVSPNTGSGVNRTIGSFTVANSANPASAELEMQSAIFDLSANLDTGNGASVSNFKLQKSGNTTTVTGDRYEAVDKRSTITVNSLQDNDEIVLTDAAVAADSNNPADGICIVIDTNSANTGCAGSTYEAEGAAVIASTATMAQAASAITTAINTAANGFENLKAYVIGSNQILVVVSVQHANNGEAITTTNSGRISATAFAAGTTDLVAFDLRSFTDRFVAANESVVYLVTADITASTDAQNIDTLQLSFNRTTSGASGLTYIDGRDTANYTRGVSKFFDMPTEQNTISATQIRSK